MPENPPPLPDFTRWPSFPFEGELRVKRLAPPVDVEPPRSGEDAVDCVACNTPDEAYIWVSERWRVRAMDRPTGLPMVLILECRSHLDLGDLPNLLAAELGVMTVRLERAVRSLDGVARVHVNRWGDGSAHLHMWFLARPHGLLQLRGTFLSLWDDILPVIPEFQWRENLAMVAAWLAEFGGRPLAEPPHIAWKSPGTYSEQHTQETAEAAAAEAAVARSTGGVVADRPQDLGDLETSGSEVSASEQTVDRLGEQTVRLNPTNAPTRDLRASAGRSASAESAPIRPATEVDEVGETTDKAEDIQEADKADVVDEASGTVRAAGAAAADHPVADASSGERAPQPEDISPKATAGDPDAATTDAGSRQTVAETAPIRPSADHGPRDAAPSGAGATPRD